MGTASLPHILMRYFTTPSVREARQSVAWSLLFIFLLYFSAPAYAAFSKLEVYTNIIGRDLASDPALAVHLGRTRPDPDLRQERRQASMPIVAACKAIAGHPGVVRLQDFVINTDVIVLSTPEIAGLPYVISGLVAAGGLAAALSTADGLLLAIANALSHDIYYKMLDPNAPAIRRLTVARVLLFFVAVCGGLHRLRPGRRTSWRWSGWAFSLAMAGNFPALVMGIWWKRATSAGAVCGIIAGFGLCLFYLVTTRYFPGMGVAYFGMTSLLNPVTGAPIVDIAKAMALPNAMEQLADAGASAGQQGRLVQPQQHQLRIAGHAARVPGDLCGQPDDQGAVGGDAGLRRRDPQAARPDGSRRKDDLILQSSHATSGVLRGPASFAASLCLAAEPCVPSYWRAAGGAVVGTSFSILAYWYYHLPNFVLAALMYTLLGRVAARPDRRCRIRPNYIWRFFCRITDPVVALVALVTPKAAAPVVSGCSASCGCSGCAWCCSTCSCCWAPARRTAGEPAHGTQLVLYRHRLLRHGQRHLQPALFAFRSHTREVCGPALLFGSVPLTLMFASLMVSTATIILGGIPAALYERFIGAKDDFDRSPRCGSGWPERILTIPAIGNFLQIGLMGNSSSDSGHLAIRPARRAAFRRWP